MRSVSKMIEIANVCSYPRQMDIYNRTCENNAGEKASSCHTLCFSVYGVHFPCRISLRHPIHITWHGNIIQLGLENQMLRPLKASLTNTGVHDLCFLEYSVRHNSSRSGGPQLKLCQVSLLNKDLY